jgi:iron complex outermembrane recepter protein
VLRASYSEGFAAPDLETMFRAPAQSFPPGLIDHLGCQIDPTNFFACEGRQRETFFTNNPGLGPEQSENWNVGIVFRPMDNLLFTLDYFNIEIDDGIANLTAQQVLDNEQRCFNEGRACDPTQEGTVIRTAPATEGGQVTLIEAPAANFAVQKTDGFDFQADWSMSTGLGVFGLNLNATYVRSFKQATAPLAPLDQTINAVGWPRHRANLLGTWAMDGWFASTLISHIPGMNDCTIAQQNQTPNWHPNCNRPQVSSMTVVDVQVGYSFPWDGDLVVGARNLFDKDPPLSVAVGTPVAPEPIGGLHTFFGRVPYVRYTQRF